MTYLQQLLQMKPVLKCGDCGSVRTRPNLDGPCCSGKLISLTDSERINWALARWQFSEFGESGRSHRGQFETDQPEPMKVFALG